MILDFLSALLKVIKIRMMLFLQLLFTVLVGLAVVLLLGAALAGIWERVRGDSEVKKLERERRLALTKNKSPARSGSKQASN